MRACILSFVYQDSLPADGRVRTASCMKRLISAADVIPGQQTEELSQAVRDPHYVNTHLLVVEHVLSDSETRK